MRKTTVFNIDEIIKGTSCRDIKTRCGKKNELKRHGNN
jgi:hypothetical protein